MVVIAYRWADGADRSLPLPSYETAGAAGADLRANMGHDITIAPGARALIPTGLHMAIPPGYEVQIRPRSGLALKLGITLVNSPGTIDSDYRGPVGVILINHGQDAVTIQHGDRIAQMVVAPVIQAQFAPTDRLPDTDRGAGGFGSTGVGP
ncbi:MAG: dUTP diphosphatase [Pseudomonadota bacterium]